MKYKMKLSHLLHSMMSFIVMLIVYRLSGMLLGGLIDNAYLAEQLSFLLSFIFAVLVFRLVPQNISPESDDAECDYPPAEKKSALKTVLHCSIAFCLMICAMYFISHFFGEEHYPDVTLSPLYFASLIVLHPMLEEYLYRKLYYGELRLLNPVFATFTQATMFALSHGSVNSMLFALMCGIILCWLAENTGRWYSTIPVHALMNLRSLLYITYFADYPLIRMRIDTVLIIIGLIAVVAFLFMQNRNPREE